MNESTKFKVLTGAYNKIVTVKDSAGNDVQLPFTFPKLRKSVPFWDTISAITTLQETIGDQKDVESAMAEVEENPESIINLMREVSPNLTLFLSENIARRDGEALTEEEEDYLYEVVLKNIGVVLEEFTKLYTHMFGSKTQNPKQVGP